MYQRLVELYPLPPNALPELASRRAETILDYLAGPGAVDPSRLETGEPRAVQTGADRPITTQLTLDVARTARTAKPAT